MTSGLINITELANEMPAYRRLVAGLGKEVGSATVTVLDAAKSYLIAAIYHHLNRPLLIVTAQPEAAKSLAEQVSAWETGGVTAFPEPDSLPYQRLSVVATTEMERLAVLAALSTNLKDGKPPLVITSVPALMQKLVSRDEFAAGCQTIAAGARMEPASLLRRWEALGYRRENLVEVPGAMSQRGGIVDIYPPASDLAARLEFFGNTVESIRLFDPASQRSVRDVPRVTITPATELLPAFNANREDLKRTLASLDLTCLNPEARAQMETDITQLAEGERPGAVEFYAPLFNHDSLFSYLPPGTLVILNEPGSLAIEAGDFAARAEELRADRLTRGELPANFPVPYFSWPELGEKMSGRTNLGLTSLGIDETGAKRLDFSAAPAYAGQLPAFMKKAKELVKRGQRLILVSHQAGRLAELLDEAGIMASPLDEIKKTPEPASITLLSGLLAQGWTMDGTHLFTDYELFGFMKERRLVKHRPVARHKLLGELTPGDFVVHIEHGIGRFQGVANLTTDGHEREYLVLIYADDDKLYVPTDQIHRVSRYVGSGESPPPLSRLGTPEWNRTKEKTKEAVEAMAQELLELYAAREIVHGFRFSADTVWQQELEASFPYVETPDQLEVISQVKEDMSRPKPMDRLICGDVGYGKTEIAVRAAFKAVMDGKQVAVLVPTTVLAQQHFNTFTQRLAAFPVRIGVLSRFKTASEQAAILEGLANGSVDICIGTHRLLQKDVTFKNLGLLIIDEEQRFGVAHKEFLKQKRREVDVLTLSATPIPRTLHMSLAGIRDISTIETPPEDRLPIKTYVAEYDEGLIKEAILRELERNGQVFFVHNRVQSIATVAQRLRELVPEARVGVGHGQMNEEELEAVMNEFSQGKLDVLVCTTIIESGLDMPNVNTLIINQADKLGLTQLYQLRGRVGRGGNLAYAYFLYDRERGLTHTAERRLQTIFEATELGAGFYIATKDLEIRGAGTLLGASQSGHISAVGFNLYNRLLAEAVADEKAKVAGLPKPPPELPAPSVDLPLSVHIPEEYVTDLATRLVLYQRLVNIKSAEEIEKLAAELEDRFGKPPPEVANLFYTVRIKLLGAKAVIESISTEGTEIIIRGFQGRHFNKQKLFPLMRYGIKIGLTQIRLDYRKLKDWQKALEEMLGKV